MSENYDADRSMNTFILCACALIYWLLCLAIMGPMQLGPMVWNILMTATFILPSLIIVSVCVWQAKSTEKPLPWAGIFLFSCLMIFPGVFFAYSIGSAMAFAHGGR